MTDTELKLVKANASLREARILHEHNPTPVTERIVESYVRDVDRLLDALPRRAHREEAAHA